MASGYASQTSRRCTLPTSSAGSPTPPNRTAAATPTPRSPTASTPSAQPSPPPSATASSATTPPTASPSPTANGSRRTTTTPPRPSAERQLLEIAPDDYKLLIETLASTGLRISEAIALQRRDLQLDELRPYLRVRRAIVRGRVEPPKSKHGRRKVPLSRPLAAKLTAHMNAVLDRTDTAWVFASQIGTPLDADNLRSRLIKPLMREIGAPWAAWHTLRHTYASLQIARGANIVQLSRALGHHAASFTLDTYIHLLDDDGGDALDLGDLIAVPGAVESLALHANTDRRSRGA